ncbi:hypothetical protein [Scopulibacillus daqui]|uniref:hypothetical protein n=1 Tax=Scopulibacillus daqui TaxID=1469162 RepID=UPI00195F8405|nr:hypothetical protein [Scopulibacillus daqui]
MDMGIQLIQIKCMATLIQSSMHLINLVIGAKHVICRRKHVINQVMNVKQYLPVRRPYRHLLARHTVPLNLIVVLPGQGAELLH